MLFAKTSTLRHNLNPPTSSAEQQYHNKLSNSDEIPPKLRTALPLYIAHTLLYSENPSMADNTVPARGGRGRGNGQQQVSRANNNNQDGGAERGGRRGGRGRGNGRGGNSNRTAANNTQNTTPNLPPPPSLPGEGIIGDRPTDDAKKPQGETRGKAPAVGEEEDEDAEVCFICASPVIHQAVSLCNHRTCHICALRLRALYKSKACAHCRVRSSGFSFPSTIVTSAIHCPSNCRESEATVGFEVLQVQIDNDKFLAI